jgi:hypothetical protein
LFRFRVLLASSLLAVLAAALVACGSSSSSGGGGEDPNTVLDQTFSQGHAKVTSGDLALKFNLDVKGSQSGTLNAELSGPFESQGNNQVPKLDFAVKASANGQGQNFNFDGGLTSTGDAAYVNYKGTDYQVTPSLFDQFKTALQQANPQGSQGQTSSKQFLQLLGVKNFKDLLTNLKNDGTSDVEGTTTNHISGDLDVNKVVDAVKNLAANASALGSLGGGTSQLPSAGQLDKIKGAIKTAHFDIYSGQDDHILRRLTIDFSIQPPSGSVDSLDLTFDLTIGKVNESQTISAPSNAKPLAGLLSQLGVSPSQLGGLGALGLGASGSGSSSGGGSSGPVAPSGSGASTGAAQKYLQCVAQAGSAADLQNCQSLAP